MRLRPKITLAVFLVSSLVSLLLAIFLYRFIDRQLGVELRTRLRDIASIGSHAIDLDAYGRLLGQIDPGLADDEVRAVEQSEEFRRVFDQLNMIRDTEPDLIRYVYILAPTGDPNRGRFVVDADVTDTPPDDQPISHFNQPYDVSEIPGLRRALAECVEVVEEDFVYDPEFKVRSVSGYFPLGASGGRCLGVLGVDITDKNMRAALDAAGGLAVRISIIAIILALLVSVVMGTLLTKSVLALRGMVGRFAEKDFTARATVQTKDEIGELGKSFNAMAEIIQAHSDNLEHLVAQRTSELVEEKQTSERLLLNVLPESIADRLKHGESVIVDRFEQVSVLFADIVGFTALSSRTSPEKLVTMLDELFSVFDRLADTHGLEKIKTIGDAYMAAAGIPVQRADHATAIARMALDMQSAVRDYAARSGLDINIRIGVHSGSVVAGVIGKRKFIYDMWGDTVNTASRMESHGVPGRVQASEATYAFLKDTFDFEPRGTIDIKGKGLMQTFLLVGERRPSRRPKPPVVEA